MTGRHRRSLLPPRHRIGSTSAPVCPSQKWPLLIVLSSTGSRLEGVGAWPRRMWAWVHNAGPARAVGRQGWRRRKRWTWGEPLPSVRAGQGRGHAAGAMCRAAVPGLRGMRLGGGSSPGPLPRPGTQLRPQEPPCAGCAAADSGPTTLGGLRLRHCAACRPAPAPAGV